MSAACSRTTDAARVIYKPASYGWNVQAQRTGYEPVAFALGTLNEVDAFCDAYLALGGSLARALVAADAVAVLERRAAAARGSL